jgi:hypothetical protein
MFILGLLALFAFLYFSDRAIGVGGDDGVLTALLVTAPAGRKRMDSHALDFGAFSHSAQTDPP